MKATLELNTKDPDDMARLESAVAPESYQVLRELTAYLEQQLTPEAHRTEDARAHFQEVLNVIRQLGQGKDV